MEMESRQPSSLVYNLPWSFIIETGSNPVFTVPGPTSCAPSKSVTLDHSSRSLSSKSAAGGPGKKAPGALCVLTFANQPAPASNTPPSSLQSWWHRNATSADTWPGSIIASVAALFSVAFRGNGHSFLLIIHMAENSGNY